MLLICALNNRARIIKDDQGNFKNQGEPTEAALKVLAEKLGKFEGDYDLNKNPNAYADSAEKTYAKVATLDFTSERKTMSTVVKGLKGENLVLLKGAPERVLSRCNGVLKSNGEAVNFKNDKEKD